MGSVVEQYFGHNYPLPRKELFGRNNGDEQTGKQVLNLYTVIQMSWYVIHRTIMPKQLNGFNCNFAQSYAQK